MPHPTIPRRAALLSLFVLLAGLIGIPASFAAAGDAATAEAPLVRFETDAGIIDIELDPERAPQTVANFLDLVDSGFYDGLIFHRVVANFVIQTGGYDREMQPRQPPRTVPNEARNRLKNRRGSVAMARLDDPDSADSQFFINVNNNTHLDHSPDQPGYTVFGHVVAGLDTTVVTIELAETGIRNDMAGVPLSPVVIKKATRIR
jgi:peptidyl-prolyl cis-trans isomerase A (cyclophilin A)